MNNLRYSFFALIFLLKLETLNCQTAQISGIINRYAAVTAIDTCSGKLTVSDTAGFQVGASVLLIQMQGAEISSANNFLYGIIQSMNFAGRYERALIDSVGPNAIFLQKRLVYTYNMPGKVQAVTIPQYANATVTDTLRCQPWNGTTGGVLALDVAGTLTINAPVLADGAGFRGGASYIGPGNNCNFLISEANYFYALGNWRGAPKGEGIALPEVGKELGRGPQANGGGGGNDHNSGGGGGGNITDGGNGGENDEPSALGCDGEYPGVRGYGSLFTLNRMFMGGGGGAGHANNALGGAGVNGGGIIIIQAGDINGSLPVISANGLSASFSNGDGAGGGGAGGTIWLKADSAPGGFIVRANGGIGGNTINNSSNRCFGPGGGGAGGRILTNLPGILSPSGGLAGVVTGSTNVCNGTTGGASNGDPGLTETLPDIPQGGTDYLLPQIVGSPLPDTVCSGETAFFVVLANNDGWDFQWQVNDGTGWQDITTVPGYMGFQTDILTVANVVLLQNGYRFRCRVSQPGCSETISTDALLIVEPSPTAGFSTSIFGYTIDFTNQSSATSYFWDFGDGATSTANNPQHTYTTEGTFTVNLYAITDCDTAVATQTVNILLPPTAGFNAPPTATGCGSVDIQYTNTSSPNATSFSWSFPGGNPATSTLQNPVVNYSATGIYTATLTASNAAGQDITSAFVDITITPLPLADFLFFVLPNNDVQFSDLSQNATSWLWDFGDGTTSTTPNPTHTYTAEGDYTVTLTVSNNCGTVSLQQDVSVFLPPTAGFFVQDSVLGCQTVTVDFQNTSSLNATSFNWSFPGGNPTTSTLENPSVAYSTSGTYTAQLVVGNSLGTDMVAQTFTVQIYDLPTANFSFQPFPGGKIRFVNLSLESSDYTWDFGDGSPQVNGVANIEHQYAASGTYTVTLIAVSPCGVSILQQNIEVVVSGTATAEPQSLGIVRLFPNPVSDWLTVDCSAATTQPVEIQIFDAGGKFVFSEAFGMAKKADVSLEGLAAGAYQVVVRFGRGKLVRVVVKG